MCGETLFLVTPGNIKNSASWWRNCIRPLDDSCYFCNCLSVSSVFCSLNYLLRNYQCETYWQIPCKPLRNLNKLSLDRILMTMQWSRCYDVTMLRCCHWVVEPIPSGLHNRYEKVKDTGSSPVIITRFL